MQAIVMVGVLKSFLVPFSSERQIMLFESQPAQMTASPNFNEIQPEYFHRSADNIINLFEGKSERQNFSKRASKE